MFRRRPGSESLRGIAAAAVALTDASIANLPDLATAAGIRTPLAPYDYATDADSARDVAATVSHDWPLWK